MKLFRTGFIGSSWKGLFHNGIIPESKNVWEFSFPIITKNKPTLNGFLIPSLLRMSGKPEEANLKSLLAISPNSDLAHNS